MNTNAAVLLSKIDSRTMMDALKSGDFAKLKYENGDTFTDAEIEAFLGATAADFQAADTIRRTELEAHLQFHGRSIHDFE